MNAFRDELQKRNSQHYTGGKTEHITYVTKGGFSHDTDCRAYDGAERGDDNDENNGFHGEPSELKFLPMMFREHLRTS